MPEEITTGQDEQILEGIQDEVQGEDQPEELSPSEEPTEAPEVGELPEDAKERTKREFEKLKEHNKQLAEENKQLKGQSQPVPSVLDMFAPQQVPQMQYVPQVPQYQQQYVEPQLQPQLVDEQGYVNADVLKSELEQVRQVRQEAEEAKREAQDARARISQFEQNAETKTLYSAYPELDPLSEVFDQGAYNLVKNEITSQIVNKGSRDAMKAAEDMSQYFRKAKPANQQVLEQRRQATSTTGTMQRPPSTNMADLKQRSLTDPNAMAERLARWEQSNA